VSPPALSIWPPLPPFVYARRPSTFPFPLGEPGCLLFARARHALWHGARALGLGAGDEVLAPAYHHGSEIEALLRAGLTCRFYGGDGSLAPDEAELEALLTPAVRALHLTHYLGFPQDAARWRAWCDARGLLLFEDAAQAWLARREGAPVGSHGDLSVFCLYKTFGLPDGAALLVRAPVRYPSGRRRLGLVALAQLHVAWLAGRSAAVATLVQPLRRGRAYDPVADMALGDPETPPARSTTALLGRAAACGADVRRRANYAWLLDALDGSVPQPFRHLPAGASPFAFPLLTDDAATVLEHLRRAGVDTHLLWGAWHPAAPCDAFPAVGDLRRRVVSLPVHQELTSRDLERIAGGVG